MFRGFLSVLVVLFMLTGAAASDFYKWEDEEGTLHITDYPPPKMSAKKIKVHKTEPGAASTRPEAAAPSPAVRPDQETKPATTHDVILYTTSWCPYCKQAKAYFESRRVPYTEYDVEKDSEAAARKKRMTDGGVPFAIVNGEHISGYSPTAYDSALRKRE